MMKIIVLDKNALLREGIVQLLSGMGNASLAGFGYSDLDRESDEARHADLVLLSVPSPERRNSLIEASVRAYAPKWLILMSDGEPARDAMNALPAVVAGFVDKSSPPEIFLACIKLVLAGGTCFPWQRSAVPTPCEKENTSPQQSLSLFSHPSKATAYSASADAVRLGLTPRQYEVLVQLARGESLKGIARRLNISVATAKSHTESVYQRLDVHNRNAAVYAALARGANLHWQAEP